MKINQELLAYSDLIKEIQKLSSQEVTGTIFITTDDNHLIRIVLDEGNITSLLLDNKLNGHDAISFIEKIKFGKIHFTNNIFETAQEVPLPKTDDLFKMLIEQKQSSIHGSSQEENEAIPVKIIDAIEQIKNTLAEEIGPFAAIACNEHIKQVNIVKTIDDILVMIDAVASEIDDSKAAQAFKDKLKAEFSGY